MCERLQVSLTMAKCVIMLLLVFSLPENYCASNSSVPVNTPANTTLSNTTVSNTTVSNTTVSSTTVSNTTVSSTTLASQFLKTTTINTYIYDSGLTPTEVWNDTVIILEDPPKSYGTGTVTSKFYAFQLGGSSAVIVIAVIIATCLVFCGRKRNASQKQSGCENPAFEEDNTTTKIPGQLDNCLPIYDYAYTHTQAYSVSPAVIIPSRSAQQLPRQQRISACSDNTESHYYTEIDDYIIKKMKLEQQQKQAHPENKARHNQDPPLNNSSHLNSPPPEYDYAYGKRP